MVYGREIKSFLPAECLRFTDWGNFNSILTRKKRDRALFPNQQVASVITRHSHTQHSLSCCSRHFSTSIAFSHSTSHSHPQSGGIIYKVKQQIRQVAREKIEKYISKNFCWFSRARGKFIRVNS